MKTLLEYINKSKQNYTYKGEITKSEIIRFVKDLGINGRERPAEDIGFKKDSILNNTPNELLWEMIGPYPDGDYLFIIKNKYGQKLSFTLDSSERISNDKDYFTILLKANTSSSGKWNGTEIKLNNIDDVMKTIEMMSQNPDKKLTRHDFK